MIGKWNIQKLYRRIRLLLLSPAKEWPAIFAEQEAPSLLFRRLLFPYAALLSVVVALVALLRFSPAYACLYGLIHFLSVSGSCWISYLTAREFLRNKMPDPDRTASVLTLYSSMVFILFHSLSMALVSGFLCQLLSLFSLVFIRSLHAGINLTGFLETGQKTNLLFLLSLAIFCIPFLIKRLLMIVFHVPVLTI